MEQYSFENDIQTSLFISTSSPVYFEVLQKPLSDEVLFGKPQLADFDQSEFFKAIQNELIEVEIRDMKNQEIKSVKIDQNMLVDDFVERAKLFFSC